jgi:recombination protein RecT
MATTKPAMDNQQNKNNTPTDAKANVTVTVTTNTPPNNTAPTTNTQTQVAPQNTGVATTGTKSLSTFLAQDNVKKKFAEVLGEKANGFITSILGAVNSSEQLKNAEQSSIYTSALMAATLDLPINQNFGFAYLVPFNDRKSGKQLCQFMLGYKGLRQLAIRSGQYKELDAKPVYEGQKIDDNSFSGYHFEWNKKTSEKIIGYVSYFKLTSGYENMFYMSKEEITAHGKQYSQTFKKGFGHWVDNFDKQALKTVSKLHLNSGYAPLSIEMQKGMTADNSVIKDADTMEVEYVDAVSHEEKVKSTIQDNANIETVSFEEVANTDANSTTENISATEKADLFGS